MSSASKTGFFKGATTMSRTTKKLTSNTPTPLSPEHEGTPAEIEDDHHTKSESAIIFEEMRIMNATLQCVASDVTTIKETTKDLKDSVERVQTQLGEAGSRSTGG